MSWFIVALGAPFVWSLVNHADKIILSRYFKGGGAGGLMIFVGTIALPLALIIYFINPTVLSLGLHDALILVASGFLYNLAVLFYLFALETEDASYIVPFWQLAPVFTYFLGVIILREFISTDKILAGLIVIFGALILSIEFEKGKNLSIRKKTVVIMILSSLCIALTNVLFKDATIDTLSFSVSMFWNQIGMLLFALVCFSITKYRNEFVGVIKQNSANVLGLNLLEQAMETVGIMINNYAILLAPAAFVILVEYTAQPLFVFVEGIIFTLLFPKLVKENISKRNLTQKLISIMIMGVGLYMIGK